MISISVTTVHKLTRLKYFTGCLGVLFLGVLVLFISYFVEDLEQSFRWQKGRVPYVIVMYSSALLVTLISAYCSFRTTRALHRLARLTSSEHYELSLERLYELLCVYFSWFAIMLAGMIAARFISAY